MPREKVLLLNPFDAYAGSQRIGKAVHTAFSESDVDVTVKLGFGGDGFLSDMPNIAPDIQVKNSFVRKCLYPFWSVFASIPTALAALRGTVIWANTVYALLPALLTIIVSPKNVVLHLHEATFAAPFHWLLRFSAWRGATIVCVSADQARRVDVICRVIPNPVNQPTHDVASLQDRILFVGTTHPVKGFALFVSVCQRLQALPLRKVAYLSDGAIFDHALVASAKSSGVDVVFGEQLPAAMYADGFVLLMCTDPSLVSETFSLIAAEAVTWLVPVGGAGATVLPEVLGDALAFDHPTRDPDRIAQDIADLYGDPGRYASLRQNCAKRRSRFSECAFSRRVIDVLKER